MNKIHIQLRMDTDLLERIDKDVEDARKKGLERNRSSSIRAAVRWYFSAVGPARDKVKHGRK